MKVSIHGDQYARLTESLNLDKSLEKDYGTFGGPHRDKVDSAGALTYMAPNSDLPRNYHPGFFFILELGIFVELNNGTGVMFSGLFRHGGTAPKCLKAGTEVEWAVRMNVILYPPSTMTDGTSMYAFGALLRLGL